MTAPPPEHPDLASLSSLDDPVRSRLYRYVSGCAGPVGRDEAAAAAGVGRALAVYHLDKLVEAGLLTASYQRPAGRGGPGAGRPAKLYARSGREFTVGFAPLLAPDGVIRLGNCPFHHLAAQDRETVCGMNLALIEGLTAGLGAAGLRPVLEPQPGHCCVAIHDRTTEDERHGA
jgi:predicted ArsR family transcriptional regulator